MEEKENDLSKDKKYMKEALKEAKEAEKEDEVPIGVVIVHEDTIVGKAHNQTKMLKDPTAHAEMIAITQATNYLQDERLLNCSIYATIEPCSMCAGAIILARIKRLVFATPDPKAGGCGSVTNIINHSKLNHEVKVNSGILEQEASSIIKKFFEKKRKQKRKKYN